MVIFTPIFADSHNLLLSISYSIALIPNGLVELGETSSITLHMDAFHFYYPIYIFLKITVVGFID